MKKKSAFTLIELLFVILIIGIISKFGVEFIFQTYENFISIKVSNKFQNQSSTALEIVSKRLQYRIKPSVIVREISDFTKFESLENFEDPGYDILEWVGYDTEGLRSRTWSGIYYKNPTATELNSPLTNIDDASTLISTLSDTNSTIDNAAIYFIGTFSNKDTWCWDGVAADINSSIIPIKKGADNNNFAVDLVGVDMTNLNLANTDYNSYQLAWTAYAVVFDKANEQLWLYSDYQPWEGEKYTDANSKILIMEEVSDFLKESKHGVMKIKVCSINTELKDIKDAQFLTCKEKTIL